MPNVEKWTGEQFDAATSLAMQHLLDNLKAYVDESPEPKELVIVAFIDDAGLELALSTRAAVLDKFGLQEKQATAAARIREKVWPEVPVIFVRDEPEHVQWLQTAGIVYAPHGATKGGDA